MSDLQLFINTVFDLQEGETAPGEGEVIAVGSLYAPQAWPVSGQLGRSRTETYFAVCTLTGLSLAERDGKEDKPGLSRRNQDCVACYALVLDDIGTKVPADKVALPPSWIMETSQGNFQYGYLLIEPLSLAEADALYVAAKRAGITDPGAANSGNRVFRVPGSYHRSGFRSRLVEMHPSRMWSVEELAAGLGLELEAPREARSFDKPDPARVAMVDKIVAWLGKPAQDMVRETFEDGRVAIWCPWRHEHTMDGGVTETVIFPGGGFKCMHGHCAERKFADLQTWCKQHGGPGSLRFDRSAFPEPTKTAKGEISAVQKATMPNVRAGLRKMGVRCRLNIMTKELEFVDATGKSVVMREILDAFAVAGVANRAELEDCLAGVGRDGAYNPMEDWILAHGWDGTPRLSDLAATVVLDEGEDPRFWRAVLQRWLLQGVQAACGWREPKQMAMVLLLTGPQGVGKTRWFGSLLPDGFFQEGAALHLDSMGAKDSMLRALGSTVVELGELDATFRKSDVAALKNFISMREDRIRRPYGRAVEVTPRATSFCGTTNTRSVLTDDTGNRRFVPFAVTRCEPLEGWDLQQVWAEVYELWKTGAQWWLDGTEEEIQQARETTFRARGDLEEKLVELFDDPALPRAKWDAFSALEIARRLGYDRPSRPELITLRTWLDANVHPQRRQLKGVRRAWLCPWRREGPVHLATVDGNVPDPGEGGQ